MLISFFYLVKKYKLKITGILHVGAHICEEIRFYDQVLPRNLVLWVEAFEDKVEQSKKCYPDILIEHAVISDVIETIPFYRSNNVESSSMFKLGLHKQFHPQVHYVETITVTTKPLKNILCKYQIPFNFVNLDIQGAELKALKSMEEYLPSIDYIYTEVNADYVYENCCLVIEIDAYLRKFGFKRVETKWHKDDKWGDAFYVKDPVQSAPPMNWSLW
jgi:FkbM family methyltransferase